MDKGLIGIKFYVGRYIYLQQMLDRLPDVRFGGRGDSEVLTVYEPDEKTGTIKRRRYSRLSPQWPELYELAKKRRHYKDQLDRLLAFWKEDRGGCLPKIASGYHIVGKTHRFNSSFWNTLKSNDSDAPNNYPVYYKDFIMRSQFEIDVAKLLDCLGLDYKYEVSLWTASDKVIYPDMAVDFPEYDECGFVEALGGLSNIKYASHNMWKLKEYINLGLYPNREIALVTSDKDSATSREMIICMLGVMLTSIAEEHVMEL